MSSFQSACEEYMLVLKDKVLSQTFGHLYPKDNRPHVGHLVFTIGGYGDITPIDASFKDIDDSPWFYDDMQDYISKSKFKRGNIYVFVGTYRKLKNQRGIFTGKTKTIKPMSLLTMKKEK